jgi:hypothetical protein
LRLATKALKLFLAYTALLAGFVMVGFLEEAVGLWAAIAWGVVMAAVVAFLIARQLRRS